MENSPEIFHSTRQYIHRMQTSFDTGNLLKLYSHTKCLEQQMEWLFCFLCEDLSDDNDLKYNISTSVMPVEPVILR